MIVNEYETDNEKVYIQVPKISGLENEEFMISLNEEYEELGKSIYEEFLINSQKSVNERDKKAELEIKQTVTYNKNDILTILGECYIYTDGYNGIKSRMVKNINTKTNTKIELKDIFCDDEYIKMLNSKLESMYDTAEYSDLWQKPLVGDSQNQFFYFSDDGLVIFYPPYELSYYSRGFVEFIIPYQDLYGYLKPDYSFLY